MLFSVPKDTSRSSFPVAFSVFVIHFDGGVGGTPVRLDGVLRGQKKNNNRSWRDDRTSDGR